MIRKLTAAAASALVLALAAPASAQQTAKGFGESGQVILGVDRLVPILSYESIKTSTNLGSSTASQTSISLVGHGRTVTFYNQPRFAIDFTVTRHLTLGGSVYAYFQIGASASTTDNQGRTTTVDQPKETIWGIAPRIGYVIPLSDSVAFWPRGGFSFNDGSHSSTNIGGATFAANTTTQFALDLEPTFVFLPFQHVGITLGGALDIPLTGSADQQTINNVTITYDVTQWHVGAHAGLLVYF